MKLSYRPTWLLASYIIIPNCTKIQCIWCVFWVQYTVETDDYTVYNGSFITWGSCYQVFHSCSTMETYDACKSLAESTCDEDALCVGYSVRVSLHNGHDDFVTYRNDSCTMGNIYDDLHWDFYRRNFKIVPGGNARNSSFLMYEVSLRLFNVQRFFWNQNPHVVGSLHRWQRILFLCQKHLPSLRLACADQTHCALHFVAMDGTHNDPSHNYCI